EEVKVPNGYEKFGDSKFKFEINKDNLGKTIEISAKNLKKQEPPTPSEKLGSIGDTVWIDKNENGIQDKDEFLADKVKVILYKEDGKTKIADMYTANGGKYLFDKLPLGSYRVKFELPEGYKFTKIGSIDKDLDSDADADDTGMTQIITLDDKNNQRLTIDAGIIKLEQKNPIKEVIKAVLPKTGEAFTSFALAGALLVLAGAIVLIVRKYKK
ncbi:LPXTG-motif cell wall anchor domain-containing protein, partial [Clostridium cavendishii DSM 21758]